MLQDEPAMVRGAPLLTSLNIGQGALSKLLTCEGGAGYGKLMVLPYVGHQMLNFILV